MMVNGSPGNSKPGVSSALAEINVTPLVDVMLVLLIVFMVSAPLMQQGVQVDLPKADAEAINEVPEQIILTVNKKKQLVMNDKVLPKGTLRKRLRAISTAKPDVQVFIHADRGVEYGFIAQVIAAVKQSRIHRVGLVTQPGDRNPNL